MPPVPDGGMRPDGGLDSGSADATPARQGDAGPVLPRADLTLVLPYEGPEQEVSLAVIADAARFDVHFSIDTTGSFGEEIDTMQSELLDRVLPGIRTRIGDLAVGVSRFEDFPVAPYGGTEDHPFTLLTPITNSESNVGAAIAALDDPLGNGGDVPEATAEALYQVATGEGLSSGGVQWVLPFGRRAAPGGGVLGGVGFREGSLRAVVHVTDAPSHAPADYLPDITGVHSLSDATDRLREMNVAVLGIASGRVARPDLERVAIDTGAVVAPVSGACATGVDGASNPPVDGVCPLVFDITRDGTGLSNAMVDALVALLDSVRFDEVYGEAVDDDLGFVSAIEARSATVPAGTTEPGREDRHPAGDDVLDTFVDVRPGTGLELVARFRNDLLSPEDYDQVFRVTVQVLGDGLVLAERVVRVVVPRHRLDADGGMDAGADASADSGSADAGDGGMGDSG